MTDKKTPLERTSHASFPLWTGDVLAGRYELGELLGQGGMGAVFEGFQTDLHRKVAIKLILPSRSDSQARRRFEREARVAAMLRHPGVVGIYDYGEHEGALFLVMEALTGPPLREQVDAHLPLLSLERAYHIAASVADTLAAAASHNLVHRDLKPENVLLDWRDGVERVVLVDFGLAFIEHDAVSGRVTQQGIISGTPHYLAPEQARGDNEITPACDVYALGCVLYEMLTGSTPFDGDVGVLIARHLYTPPPGIGDLRPPAAPPVPGVVEDLVKSMMEKEAADRPAAAVVASVLRGLDPAQRVRSSEHDDESSKVGRAARMVSVRAPARTQTPIAGTEQVVRLGVLGEISQEQRLALAVGGVRAERVVDGRNISQMDVLFVRSPEQLEQSLHAGKPVLLEVENPTTEELRLLIAGGVNDVVRAPWDAGVLAKQVRRAARQHGRKKR